MSKSPNRKQWIKRCLLWTLVWFALSAWFPGLWIFSLISLAMLLAPVGSEKPSKTHAAHAYFHPYRYHAQGGECLRNHSDDDSQGNEDSATRDR